MGGIGAERDISIQSGSCVTQALKEAGLNSAAVDIQPNNMDILKDNSIDVFFIALHGEFGEDGQLQQILEDKSLTYTGSGPAASRLAFDKLASKKYFARAGITAPKAIKFDVRAEAEELQKQLRRLGERFVVKPIEFISGREITVGVVGNRALPIIEVKSKTGFYDYQAKYIDEQTEFLFGTIDNPALIGKIEAAALDCFDTLGCRHFARVDFILDGKGIAYALEVNTIPGFTAHSLLPRAAEKAGLSMSNLCVKIIETALEERKLNTIH